MTNAFIRIDPKGFICIYSKPDPPDTLIIWKALPSPFMGHDNAWCGCIIGKWLEAQGKIK